MLACSWLTGRLSGSRCASMRMTSMSRMIFLCLVPVSLPAIAIAIAIAMPPTSCAMKQPIDANAPNKQSSSQVSELVFVCLLLGGSCSCSCHPPTRCLETMRAVPPGTHTGVPNRSKPFVFVFVFVCVFVFVFAPRLLAVHVNGAARALRLRLAGPAPRTRFSFQLAERASRATAKQGRNWARNTIYK